MEVAIVALTICFVAYIIFNAIMYNRLAKCLEDYCEDHDKMSKHYEEYTKNAGHNTQEFIRNFAFVYKCLDEIGDQMTDWAKGANKNNEQFCKEIDDLKKFAIRKDAEYANQHGHDFDEEEK